MFTDRLITGGTIRPDIRFIAVQVDNGLADIKDGSYFINTFTALDYFPIVSVGSGFCRVLAGIIHAVAHLALAIFDKMNRLQHLQEANLAVKNILRGWVALVPIIGNIALALFDGFRIPSEIAQSVKFERNFAILYEGGKEVSRVDARAFYQRLKLESNPSAQKTLEIMRGGIASPNDNPIGGILEKKRSIFALWGKSPEADSRIQQIYSRGGNYMDVAIVGA